MPCCPRPDGPGRLGPVMQGQRARAGGRLVDRARPWSRRLSAPRASVSRATVQTPRARPEGGRAGLRISGTRPCDSVPRGVIVSWHLPLDFATKRCAPPFPSPRSPSFRLDTSKAAAAVPRCGASRRAVGMGRCPPSGVSGWARNHRRPRARGRGSAGRGRRMSLGGVCVRARGKSGGAPSGGPTPPLRPPRLVSLAPALGWVGLGTRGWPGGARGGGAEHNTTRKPSVS